MASVRTRCSKCGQSASADRRFCGGCGARLWEPCLACQTLNSVAEKFCAECGIELEPAVAAAVADLQAILQAAALLEGEGKLLEAVEHLATVTPSDHSRLVELVQEAARLREELTTRRQQIVSSLFESVADAQQLVESRRYAAAAACLERIPVSLRNQQARALLEESQKHLAEIADLRARVSQARKQGGVERLLNNLLRLRELEPHAEDVERLCKKLSAEQHESHTALARKLLKRARDAIVTNDYRTAEACLRKMPVTSPEGTHELTDAIEERVWLTRQVTTAPYADPTLRAIASRLVKLQPKDETARLWLTKIDERLARMKQTSGAPLAPWVKPTADSRIGAPVTPIDHVTGITWDAKSIDGAGGASDVRRQVTAVGLALVGLGKGTLDFDLRPDRASWRERLAEVRKLGRATAAWGLDLGSNALKYVRLATNKADELLVDRAGVIACGGNQQGREAESALAVAAALKEFIERYQPTGEPVVLGLPSTQTLGRCFQLPLLKPARRFRKLLEYEVRNQIPLPLDEIEYGAHTWPGDPTDEAFATHVRVTVAAAKRSHIDLRIGVLGDRDIRLASLQSECVAVVNVLHQAYAEQISHLQLDEAIALVDVGASSTLVAVASRRGSCFRAVHQGLHGLNKELARARSITLEQAERLRQEWHAAEAMYRLDAAIMPGLNELTRAVHHAIETCCDTLGTRLTHVYLAGGGCYQFGLLRHWSEPDSLADANGSRS